ncbi:MAG TPA: SRPBCC domain-containing protein [Acidimicrobiales bacterium]|nr:SRPBCC domain-containing protein [Acidimicrobiales bacterium]
MADVPLPSIEGTLYSVNGEGVVRMQGRFESDRDDVWSALTNPQRLAQWYGKVEGDLRVGGEFTAFVLASEWDGRGRIEACVPQRRLEVTTWEEERAEHVVAAELIEDGNLTVLVLEVRALPLDLVWAYGVGWQVHLEDLGAHLSGQDSMNLPNR